MDDNDDADDNQQQPQQQQRGERVSAATDPLIDVSPSELRIQCQLNTEVSYAITLQNTSTRLVAFKVKTTAPKRYMVRPNQGYIRPGETSPVSIILVRQTQYPDASNPRNVRDKFLVQSMPVDREVSPDDLASLWVEKERQHKADSRVYYEHRLKCRLVIPPPSAAEPQHQRALISAPPSDAAPTTVAPPSIVVTPPAPVDRPGPVADVAIAPAAAPESTLEPPPLSAPSTATALATGAPASAAPASSAQPNLERPEQQQRHPDSGAAAEPVPPEQRSASIREPQEAVVVPAPASETPESARPAPASSAGPADGKPDAVTSGRGRTPTMTATEFASIVDRPREYEKMLAYSVKLTAEREAIEVRLLRLREHNEALMRENDALRRAAAASAADSLSSSPTAASQSSEFSVLDALHDKGIRTRPPSAKSGVPTDHELSTAQAARELSAGQGIQLWQIVAIAALCFLLGRIL